MRAKIRGDYQQRLDQVIEQLRTHAASVAEQLATLRVRQDDLAGQEEKAQETLAEAELRHAVGEYEESEWERVRGGSERLLIDVREELARVSDEITRLGEVQALIAAAPEAPAEPEPEPELSPAAAGDEDAGDDWEPLIPLADTPAEPTPAAPPSAPRFTPRGASRTSEPVPPRTIPFPPRAEPSPDDLAFIKSMADEQPTPKRPSGAAPRVSDAGGKPTEEPPRVVPGNERPSQAAVAQDPEVRRVRDAQPADGVVLRTLRRGAGRALAGAGAGRKRGPAGLPGPVSLRAMSSGSGLGGGGLGQAALLPRGSLAVHQVLPAGAIEQARGLGEGLAGLGLGAGGADLLDGGAQLAPLSLVAGRANLGLAHALLGGLDAGHSGPL